MRLLPSQFGSYKSLFVCVLVCAVACRTLAAQSSIEAPSFAESLIQVSSEIERGSENAAAQALRQYFETENESLFDFMNPFVASAAEAQYIAMLLMLDGASLSVSKPERAIPILYLSSSLHSCSHDPCAVGTHGIWNVSTTLMRWTLALEEFPVSPTELANEYVDLVLADRSASDPMPPIYGFLAGGQETFVARRQIPDLTMLLPLVPIKDAFHVILNNDSEQAVAFVDELMATTGIRPEIEETTHYTHLVLSLEYNRELAARLLAATPELLERYNPNGGPL